MNCWADIGVPSGCQNVVAVMCWMVRALGGCVVGYSAVTMFVIGYNQKGGQPLLTALIGSCSPRWVS
jgi:hypothetical protein